MHGSAAPLCLLNHFRNRRSDVRMPISLNCMAVLQCFQRQSWARKETERQSPVALISDMFNEVRLVCSESLRCKIPDYSLSERTWLIRQTSQKAKTQFGLSPQLNEVRRRSHGVEQSLAANTAITTALLSPYYRGALRTLFNLLLI